MIPPAGGPAPVDRGGDRPETGEAARLVAAVVRSTPASVAGVRITAVDGPSGSGKSTVAHGLARELGAAVIHLDDLYEGWDGLATVDRRLAEWVIEPLRRGQAPRWRRFDWVQGAYAEWCTTPVTTDLVLEGCGSGAGLLATDLAVLVWVRAPEALRERRLRARADWAWYEPHRPAWARQERQLRARDATEARADVVVDNADRVAVRITGHVADRTRTCDGKESR